MWDLLSQPVVRVLLGLTILCPIVYFAAMVIKALRPATVTDDTSDDQLFGNFEEMLRDGDIDDAELRRIQAVIGTSQQARQTIKP